MNPKEMSFKALINNYAKSNGIASQVVLQNFMFDKFLKRLSISKYKDNFIIKGGMLIASIVGLNTRSTMDLDTTLMNMALTEDGIIGVIKDIANVELKDGIDFLIKDARPIRKDDIYGGYCIRLNAIAGTIIVPLSIDVSTGDVITPSPMKYTMTEIFDEESKFELWGYNLETILAEKVEAILSRGIYSTRPRDYYDVYILSKTKKINVVVFKQALKETTMHRGTSQILKNADEILLEISKSEELLKTWVKYKAKFSYASNIQFEETVNAVKKLISA